MDEEIVRASMEIILNAGDARVENLEVLRSISTGDFEGARQHLTKAEETITVAHRAQTDKIQAETSGEPSIYSLLFAHAQDTLMTINSEITLTKGLVEVFESYEQRIAALEAKTE